MNVMVIAKLAKDNNSTLATLVNRWTLDGNRANPFPDIFLKSQAIGFASTCFWIVIVAMLLGIYGYMHRVWATSHIYIVSVTIGLLVSAWAFCHWKMKSCINNISDHNNLDKFCSAVALLERLYYEMAADGCDMWREELHIANAIGQSYLYSQADELMRLEKIPWRKEDEQKFRKKFVIEFDLLTHILSISTNRKEYFERKQAGATLESQSK